MGSGKVTSLIENKNTAFTVSVGVIVVQAVHVDIFFEWFVSFTLFLFYLSRFFVNLLYSDHNDGRVSA